MHDLPWMMIITVITIIGAVIFFVQGKIRSDLVALVALLFLMVTGVLTPAEAFTGFSNPIIFTIAAMFVVSGAIVNSGLAHVISGSMLKMAGSNDKVLFMLIMLITALIGSLVSNTGTVAIMLPIVGSLALAINMPPSRFLMPLAFMAGIGGMLTLVGNPPNMVVNDVYVRAGFESLKLFSFLPIGIICMIYGVVILCPVTAWYLGRRAKKNKDEISGSKDFMSSLVDKYSLSEYAYEVSVPLGSKMAGRSLVELDVTSAFGVIIQEVRRRRSREQLIPTANTVIMGGDTLLVLGTYDGVAALTAELGLRLDSQEGNTRGSYRFDAGGICELVIMSASRLVNKTIGESFLRQQFGVTVLAIQRGDHYIFANLKDQVVHSGDSLLVQGTWDNINRLEAESTHWVVVGKPMEHAVKTNSAKIPHVIVILAAMIFAMATGIIPTVLAALIAAVLMIVSGCFRNMRETYAAISWETLIMIACMLPLATAMEKTGVVAVIGGYMTMVGEAYGPLAALGVIYIVTSLLNVVISFTPLALLIAPIAMNIAQGLHCDPLPFMFAVAASAGLCFGSSFSTPSNALVVSAGHYTFMDYLKIGLPLQLLLGVILIFAIPMIFPF